MNRRRFLAAIGALSAAPAVTATGAAASSPTAEQVRDGAWPQWEVTARVNIPRVVYETARERLPDDADDGALEEALLFEYIRWDYQWTVNGQPVDDLPSP